MSEETPQAKIMLVDDTPENLAVLASMLRDRGYRIFSFPRGAMALKAAERDPPDLILLDINMPEMNGYEVCKRLKDDEKLREIPVIFISALNELTDKVQAFTSGGVDYVAKPFQIEEVVARVEAHLELRGLRQKLEKRNRELDASLMRQQELEALKEQLVQMIVHDLRSPLAAILGNLTVLANEVQCEPEIFESIEDIEYGARTMQRLVGNMLDVTRQEDGSMKVERKSANIRRLLTQATRIGAVHARMTGQKLEVDVDEGLTEVMVDPDLVLRLVENLVDNALKYAPGGSTIRVVGRTEAPSNLVLEVVDEGAGIPDESKEKIFEPYQRLARDAKTHARKSRGLGLAFCKLAAEAHGGRIWVEDNQPKGTRFICSLPLD